MSVEPGRSALVVGLVLLACSSESSPPDSAPLKAAESPVATSAATALARPLSPELLARVSQVPAFERLPASDRAWVLAKAGARLDDAKAPALEPLIQQLAEVRQFAVAEREEPMPSPSLAAEVP